MMADQETRKAKIKEFILTIFQQDGHISTMVMFLILLGIGVSASLGKWIVTKYTILPLCVSVFMVYKILGCLFTSLIFCFPGIFVCSKKPKDSVSISGVLEEEQNLTQKSNDCGRLNCINDDCDHDQNSGVFHQEVDTNDEFTARGPPTGEILGINMNVAAAIHSNVAEIGESESIEAEESSSEIEVRNNARTISRRRTTTLGYRSLGSDVSAIDESKNNDKIRLGSTCQRIKDNIPLAGVLFFVVLVCLVNMFEIFTTLDCIDEYQSVKDIDHTSSFSSMYTKSVLHVGNLVTWTIFAVMLTVFCCKILYQEERLYKFWPVRLGLVHLLATLLTVWCNYQFRESSDVLEQTSYFVDDDNCAVVSKSNISHSLDKGTIECLCQNTSMFNALVHNAGDYILPVNVEFCLLVSESIVHMLLCLEPKKNSLTRVKSVRSSTEYSSTDAGHGIPQMQQELERFGAQQERTNPDDDELQPLLQDTPDQQRKTVLDIIVYIAAFFLSIIYLLLKIIKALGIGGKRRELWEDFYSVYLICFWLVAILVSIWGLFLVLHKFKVKSAAKHSGFEMLMILSAFGFYLHASLTLIAAFSTKIHEPTNSRNADMLIATTTLDSIQILLQIVLMFKISGKASLLSNSYGIAPHGHLKCVIIYFVVINFVLWIVASFIERKSSSEMDVIQMAFYGNSVWVIIYHVTYPLMLYFRFNSFLHLSQSALKIYF